MSPSILGTDPSLPLSRPDRQSEVIGKTDCLGVAEVNMSLPTYRQTPLNTVYVALRPLKALSSLLCHFLSHFQSITPQLPSPVNAFLSVICYLYHFYPRPLNVFLWITMVSVGNNLSVNDHSQQTDGVSLHTLQRFRPPM